MKCLSFFTIPGRTHDSSYSLYRLGERLSQGARQYVETGRADGLDAGGESPSTLHSFVGPPVPQGEGTSVGRAFLDGNHTLVSVMARINPSPDWFVGVDAFQLCVEGNWVDTVTVEVSNINPIGLFYKITVITGITHRMITQLPSKKKLHKNFI